MMFFENMPPQHIQDAYHQLVREVDAAVAAISTDRFPNKLHCRPGCSSCCIDFSVSPLEAALVERCHKKYVNISVNVNQEEGRRNGICLFLNNQLCSVYDCRPIICRTQGLALGYVDDLAGTIEVSACELNFPADMPLEFEDLLLMDAFNKRLAVLNVEYCQIEKINPELRVDLADLFLG